MSKFEGLTQSEIDDLIKNAPLNHVRIIASTEISDWCALRVPEMFNAFNQHTYTLMNEFCKEMIGSTENDEANFHQLTLESFQAFFAAYNQCSRRLPYQMEQDINELGTRLVMNYYVNRLENGLRSLTLMVDFLPEYMLGCPKQFQKFQVMRSVHEFELNFRH